MNMEEWEKRTILLLGKERIEHFHKSHVLIVGLGGVGAYAAEMVARAGIGEITIIDGDIVQQSNINRQLPAVHSSIGRPKSEVVKERLYDINPQVNLHVLQEFIKDERITDLLEKNTFNFIIDAIDSISPKIQLISKALEKNTKIISSMGAGAKTDPSKIRIDDISKSFNCGLAKVVRKRLKEIGIYKGLPVVFSSEPVKKEAIVFAENEQNKLTTTGTFSYMTALFGCLLASYVIRNI